MSALARWLERRELPVIDEATARERCSPLTDAEGNRKRLIAVAPQERPALGPLLEEYSRLKRATRQAARDYWPPDPIISPPPSGYGVHMDDHGRIRKNEPDAG